MLFELSLYQLDRFCETLFKSFSGQIWLIEILVKGGHSIFEGQQMFVQVLDFSLFLYQSVGKVPELPFVVVTDFMFLFFQLSFNILKFTCFSCEFRPEVFGLCQEAFFLSFFNDHGVDFSLSKIGGKITSYFRHWLGDWLKFYWECPWGLQGVSSVETRCLEESCQTFI